MLSDYYVDFRRALRSWWLRDAFSQSAAAAYYAVFSLPGLLMIIMAIAAIALEQQRVENEILSHLRHVMGPAFSDNVKIIIDNFQRKNRDIWAIAIGASTLLFGATGLFAQLQKSLNQIWGVEVKKSANIRAFLKTRFTALGISISIGFLLLISLFLTAALTAISEWVSRHFSESLLYLFYIGNYFLSLGTVSVLFALIYKILPDIELKWRDALRGGFLSALLFTAGEYGLSFYFKLAKPESAFDQAGSLILFLLWTFYSCLILLYGAEFIRSSLDRNHERKPTPTDIAKHKKNT